MSNFVHVSSDDISDAKVALRFLKEGNRRFLSGQMISKQYNDAEWFSMQEGQHPFAAILSCSDSRVSPEVIFDQRNGDLFIVRNAGNIADSVALGSLEYAVRYLQVPLIVVCGHKNCGAVNAAFNKLDNLPDNLNASMQCIVNSIEGFTEEDKACRAHTTRMAEIVRTNPVMLDSDTKVVEAYYDISTGEVVWRKESDLDHETT